MRHLACLVQTLTLMLLLTVLTPAVAAAGVTPKAAAELETSPYLTNLIHPGTYDYLQWNRQEIDQIGTLWDQMLTDPEGMRQAIYYELMELNSAIADLRAEVYSEPVSKFRYVPLHTSGKWRAIDKAFQARLFLLAEAARREGKNSAPKKEKADLLTSADILMEDGERLTAISPEEFAARGGALSAAVLRSVGRASLPAGLMQAGHQAPDDDLLSFLDRDLIWFMPFKSSGDTVKHYGDGREIALFLDPDAVEGQIVREFFRALGRHFGQAYLGQSHSQAWQEYLTLRGNQLWVATDAAENLAADFADTYLPSDLRQPLEVARDGEGIPGLGGRAGGSRI